MKPAIIDNQDTLEQPLELFTWRPLKLLNSYRLLLALTFTTLSFIGFTGNLLGTVYPTIFFWVSLFYSVMSVAFIYASYIQSPGFQTQVIIQGCVDIITISVLMHSSGGIESGLGMLLIVNVTATSIFLSKQLAYLFAALASIAVLTEQITTSLASTTSISYPKAGILGLLFFASATIASTLAQRSRENEMLASQRKADIADLVKLNEHIIQNMRTGIVVVTPNAQIYMANSAAEVLLGNRKLDGRPHLSNVSPALFKRLKEWQQQPDIQQIPIPQEQGLPDLQPGMSKLDDSRPDSEVLIFLEDAAQLNQRFQQVKLASLGRLTASIAHEIRNPLGAINHAAQLLNESLNDAANIKLCNIINTQVQRMNHIIENILQLSRQNSSNIESVQLNDWLLRFKEEFCASQGLDDEQVTVNILPRQTSILFDQNHLHQVIWNLCTNAISHCGKAKNAITIQLQGGVTMDSRQPFLDIIDNGQGIEPEFVHQIFDPFFTTSTNGTGLGLYITKEMIESNRAKIRYIPLPRGGSCFRIHFIAGREELIAQAEINMSNQN